LKASKIIFYYSLLVVLSGFLISSCVKKEKPVVLQQLASPVNSRINKLLWRSPDTVFICGGLKNAGGFIYRSTNSGLTWTQVYQSGDRSVYDMFFMNDTTAYASGDKLLFIRSKNIGQSWENVPFDFIPEYFNYVPMRCIFGDEKLLMIAGGENYDNGAVMWMVDGQLKWVWHFDNEFRTGLNFAHNNYEVMGYGTSYKTADLGYTYSPAAFKGDFITGSALLTNQTAYGCGYNGGIYKTNNAGALWQTVLKPNSLAKKRIHFNAIHFKDNNGWAVGNEGLIMHTQNGNVWEKRSTKFTSDFLSICESPSGQLVITTSKGEILLLNP
jgi:photosystem II stability/assembly factor-like uncharacterized protein